MSDDNELMELMKLHRAGEVKYAYFLLAAAGSALAFAVQKTDDLKLTWSLIPLGLAVISWLFSLFYGCKHIILAQYCLYDNFSLVALHKGMHPEQPDHPELVEVAIKGTTKTLNDHSTKVGSTGEKQYIFLIAGVILFLLWHILEMIIRTFYAKSFF